MSVSLQRLHCLCCPPLLTSPQFLDLGRAPTCVNVNIVTYMLGSVYLEQHFSTAAPDHCMCRSSPRSSAGQCHRCWGRSCSRTPGLHRYAVYLHVMVSCLSDSFVGSSILSHSYIGAVCTLVDRTSKRPDTPARARGFAKHACCVGEGTGVRARGRGFGVGVKGLGSRITVILLC
jgi:hypothetical protein